MKIGPFRVFDVENVEEVFNARGVKFNAIIDRELEKQLLDAYHARATTAPRQSAGSLNLSIVYFEIDDTDFTKIQFEVEKYGIVPQSDGSYELGED